MGWVSVISLGKVIYLENEFKCLPFFAFSRASSVGWKSRGTHMQHRVKRSSIRLKKQKKCNGDMDLSNLSDIKLDSTRYFYSSGSIGMYVCSMYVQRSPFVELPMEWSVPTGPRGGTPSGSWVQYPNPAVPTMPRHSRWIILAHLCAFSDPTLLQAAKDVLYPHVGGTVTRVGLARFVYSSYFEKIFKPTFS